jgi:peptide/nickel transport system permease protein
MADRVGPFGTATGAHALAWRRFRANAAAMIGLVVLAAIALFVLAADLVSAYVTGFTPGENHLADKLLPPFTDGYILGSDRNGRDILTRLAYGGRVSLMVAALATLATLAIGGAIGLAAGYLGGWVDAALMRLVDVLLAVPTFYVLILIATLYAPGPVALGLILAAVSWIWLARLVRGEVLALRKRPFVEAAVVLGASPGRIMLRHVLPNVVPLLIVSATFAVPGFIMMEAGLSFLGMGVRVPDPSWGNMLHDAGPIFRQSWTAVFFPGLLIYLTTLAVYLVGGGLRDALDPRGRR